MSRSKSLYWFLGSIIFLALMSTAVLLSKQELSNYLPDSTPENVVHNYLIAVQKQDAATLAEILSPDEGHPSAACVRTAIQNDMLSLDNLSIDIKETFIEDDIAWVTLRIYENNNILYGGSYAYNEQAVLKMENGHWRIKELPYWLMYWYWDNCIEGD